VWAAALVRAPVGVGGSSGSFLSVDHAERIGKGGQQARVKAVAKGRSGGIGTVSSKGMQAGDMWWSGLGRGQPSHDVAGAERGLVRREKRPASIGATARRVLPVPGERLQRLTGAPCYFVVDG
jgi:hypothetical protein